MAKTTKPKKPLVAPQKRKYIEYSVELGEIVCERIAMREPISKICKDPNMPSELTLYRWRRSHEEFAKAFEAARAWRAETRSDRIDDYIDQIKRGTLDANGGRVIIDAEKWQASKEQPQRYGDKIAAELSGKDGGPLTIDDLTPDRRLNLARTIALIFTSADKVPEIGGPA